MCESATVSDRLTVVFDDPTLYRRVKIRAAEQGVPVKKLIEAAIEAFLAAGAPARKPFDFEAFARWQAGMDALDRANPPAPGELENLSDIKHHLYGYDRREERANISLVAEDRAEYGAR
jgi:hypothetical protein